MPKHATDAEPVTHVERLTRTALQTGRTALVKFGPEGAVAAMTPWAEAIAKAERKAARRVRA